MIKLLFSFSIILSLLSTSTVKSAGLKSDIDGIRQVTAGTADFALEWTIEGVVDGDEYGYSVGTAGNVNGDSYMDIIVGAPRQTLGTYREGVAYVYHGSAGGVSDLTYDWAAGGGQQGIRFGNSVAAAGDVNGDTYDDVIIGAYRYKNEEAEEGAVYVYHGSSSGLASTPDWMIESNQKDAHLGYAVGTAGDVNHDGYADVIVGARWYTNGEANEGKAFVFLGSSGGLADVPVWSFESDQANAALGSAIGTAGDVNHDGYDDVVVGAPLFDSGLSPEGDEGRVWVFYGSDSGPRTDPDWIFTGDQAGAELGTSVSTAGDVNQDNYADLLIGAPGYGPLLDNEGAAFLFRGSAGGLSSVIAWSAAGGATGARFGQAVNTAGDLNQDGYADVIVGAPGYNGDQPLEGQISVFLGTNSGLWPAPVWQAEGDKSEAGLGFAVGPAGDVNHDDYDDFIIGAPEYRRSETIVGRAYLFHGAEAQSASSHIFFPLVINGS